MRLKMMRGKRKFEARSSDIAAKSDAWDKTLGN